MLSISVSMRFVSIGLSRLSQQDHWRCICGLQTESEIQQDEWIWIVIASLIAFNRIQIATTTVCATRNVGVPKKRAKPSAFTPNQSLPNVEAR